MARYNEQDVLNAIAQVQRNGGEICVFGKFSMNVTAIYLSQPTVDINRNSLLSQVSKITKIEKIRY